MSKVLCEVIGCKRPAAWICVIELNLLQEDYLCDACWLALCKTKPEQANCYAVYDEDLATTKDLAHSCGSWLPGGGTVSQSMPMQ